MRMKMLATIALLAAATGSAAAAQGYKPFKPAGFQPPARTTPAPAYKPAPTTPPATTSRSGTMTPQAPATAPAFKPYEPWKPAAPTSLYGPDGKRKKVP